MTPIETLEFIISEYDDNILNEYRKIEAIFKDLCNDPLYIKEANLLLLASKMRIPSSLHHKGKADSFLELGLAKRMSKDFGISYSDAIDAVISWSNAIYQTSKESELLNDFIKIQRDADCGDVDKQFELGKIYFKGSPKVNKNLEEAFKYFLLAAKSGHAASQNYVGYCYEYGLGVNRNIKHAFSYYGLSAKNKNTNGMYNLANCFEYGIGTEQDESSAFSLYKELSDKSFSEAIFKLAWFYDYGITVIIDKAQALTLYERAAKNGSVQAQYHLGLCYQYGDTDNGIQIDLGKAKNYYHSAAKSNHKKAKKKLAEL